MVVIPIFFLCEFCLGYVWCVCVCALLLILIYRYKQNVLIFCWFIISTTKNLSYQQSWWLQRLITTKIISIDLWWTKKNKKVQRTRNESYEFYMKTWKWCDFFYYKNKNFSNSFHPLNVFFHIFGIINNQVPIIIY